MAERRGAFWAFVRISSPTFAPCSHVFAGTGVADIGPLARLPLVKLRLGGCAAVASCAPLATCTALQALALDGARSF